MNLSFTPPPGIDLTESGVEPPDQFKTKVLELMAKQEWRRYPLPQPKNAITQLATHWGIDPDLIQLTAGADAAVDQVTFLAQASNSSVLHPTPSYPGYRRALRKHGVPGTPYPAETSLVDAISISSRYEKSTLIYCYPGNPLGPDQLDLPGNHLPTCAVYLDATYLNIYGEQFASVVRQASTVGISVIFSLSKTAALAGLRLGGIVHSCPKKAEDASASLPRFGMDLFQLCAWEVAVQEEFRLWVKEHTAAQLVRKSAIQSRLNSLGYRTVPSASSSFVTVIFETETETAAFTADHPSIPGKAFQAARCVRITINDRAVESVKAAEPSPLVDLPGLGARNIAG